MGGESDSQFLRMGTDEVEYQSYDSVPDRLSATLLGVTVTSVLFLTGISFALNKGGSIVETSLIFAYVSTSHLHGMF